MYEPFFCENTQFDNIKYDNTVLALLTIEGLGLTVGGLLILATFLYFCFIDKLKTTFIVIQSQVQLQSNHLKYLTKNMIFTDMPDIVLVDIFHRIGVHAVAMPDPGYQQQRHLRPRMRRNLGDAALRSLVLF